MQGPSSEALHLGHLVPFHFTKWLQDAFKVRVARTAAHASREAHRRGACPPPCRCLWLSS